MAAAARVSVAQVAIAVLTGTGINVPSVVRNRGTAAVYLGGSAVTTSTGFQLDIGEAVSVYLAPGEILYGISVSGTHVVHGLQGSV